MSTYDAAGSDRLLADWSGYWSRQLDAVEDWDREGLTLGQRAWKLVLNDPYATALMDCVIGNVLGSGLRLVSAFQADDGEGVTDAESAARRAIDNAVAAHSLPGRLDPAGQLSRVEIEEQLLVSGFVAGDGFAVRSWSPDRPEHAGFSTCWRVIDAARVMNPQRRANAAGRLVNGIELRNGVPVALHVKAPGVETWEKIDWFASDGSRNVIHYAPDRRRAGAVRGFSKFAPILKIATHLARLATAHISGKRVQASHPMAIKTTNPADAAKAHRAQAQLGDHSAISEATILFVDKTSDVTFPSFSYQGQDFDAFVKTNLMAFTASWGYPWQFVLHQLTDANLAAAQAALDQADKTTTVYQDKAIASVIQPIDASILREAQARGTLGLPAATPIARLTVGTYDRPRRADANRLRTRQAAELSRKLGVSPSTVMAEMGYNWQDEIRRTRADLAFAAEQGVDLNAAAEPMPEPEPEPEPELDDDASSGEETPPSGPVTPK